MTKLFVLSDCGTPTGYGRIADETLIRLSKRGYEIFAAGINYDGLLPAAYEGERLPYWVASLGGRDWLQESVKIIGVYQPDIIIVIQDAPYAEGLRNAPLDWSKYGFIVVTPVDGAPIYPKWIAAFQQTDALMNISQFGVDEYRKAGIHATLLRPGVNGNRFYRLPDVERAAIRAKLGMADDAFLVGTMCMNQGRKAITLMMQAFFEFATDKPSARYLMDMDPQSPAGWDIPAVCKQQGWDVGKIIFRHDAMRLGVMELRDRYNALDAHMVISHREGYGLPLTEAMACGVVSIAMDYCSGTEIVGGGRGMLIPHTGYEVPGTWGGAVDKFPDMRRLVMSLQALYDYPSRRAVIAERGMKAARAWTWDAATDALQETIDRVVAGRARIPPPTMPLQAILQSAPQTAPAAGVPDGIVRKNEALRLLEADTLQAGGPTL
jgi:hypothetical protein